MNFSTAVIQLCQVCSYTVKLVDARKKLLKFYETWCFRADEGYFRCRNKFDQGRFWSSAKSISELHEEASHS